MWEASRTGMTVLCAPTERSPGRWHRRTSPRVGGGHEPDGIPRPDRRRADVRQSHRAGAPRRPVLVQVPVGSGLSAGLLDAAPPLRPAATAMIGTGVLASVPAALSGAADWSEQEPGVRRLGALHALLNVSALGLYAGSLVARGKGRGGLGRVLSYTGLGLATVSASIGGHMSYAQSSGASHAATAARALPHDWIDLGPLDDLPEGRPALRTGSGGSADVPLAVVRRGVRVDVFIGPCSH